MIDFDPNAHEKMLLLFVDKKVAEEFNPFMPPSITRFKVTSHPSEPDDQRIVLALFSGGDDPTATFAMSAAAAEIIHDKLGLAIAKAKEGRKSHSAL